MFGASVKSVWFVFLTKVIAEIWNYCDTAKNKSNRERILSSVFGKQIKLSSKIITVTVSCKRLSQYNHLQVLSVFICTPFTVQRGINSDILDMLPLAASPNKLVYIILLTWQHFDNLFCLTVCAFVAPLDLFFSNFQDLSRYFGDDRATKINQKL